MPGAGIETYRFSTRCRSFCKRADNSFDSALRICIHKSYAHSRHKVKTLFRGLNLVPGAGIEPARPCGHKILSLAWLPITPSRHVAKIIAHLAQTALLYTKINAGFYCYFSLYWSTSARWRSGNAAVCKTDMHGFDSRPGLNSVTYVKLFRCEK